MVRHFFIAAYSSVLALAASALHPVAAAETENAPTPAGMPSFPEPEPIVVDPAAADRARRLLDAVARGTFDRSELLPQLDAFVRPEAFVMGATLVSALGPPQSMFAFEKRIMAEQTSTYFRVHFPKEILTWVVSVGAQNRITGLSLQRGPHNIIFGVVWRNIQY